MYLRGVRSGMKLRIHWEHAGDPGGLGALVPAHKDSYIPVRWVLVAADGAEFELDGITRHNHSAGRPAPWGSVVETVTLDAVWAVENVLPED